MRLPQVQRETAVPRTVQPALHNLAVCLRAPTLAVSGLDGQLRGEGAQGVLHGDVRVLSVAIVRVDGQEPEAISSSRRGAGGYRFTGLLRALGTHQPDPTVRLDRTREVSAGRCAERLVLSSTASIAVPVRLEVDLEADLAGIDLLKLGRARPPVRPTLVGHSSIVWREGRTTSTLTVLELEQGGRLEVRAGGAMWTWEGVLAPRTSTELGWDLLIEDAGSVVGPAPGPAGWSTPSVHADDRRLAVWLRASLDDLDALRMVTTDQPHDDFVAAGVPWYLTLFGRDSIWAARMVLPLGTGLAAGTLRALAARQGTVHDRPSQQQPGKILHELRRTATVLYEAGVELPATYYGTVDATPLWVCLLHDAWRWGMASDEVQQLLPAAKAALDWLLLWADPDDDGFIEYVDSEGTGLTNQGWKDSGDSVRFDDGTQASAPIALAEVQGYAHEAFVHGADLLEAFGVPRTDPYRQRAAQMRTAFARGFWVTGQDRRYPALALDADKRRVDAVASNMGHLPGTGLLAAEDERDIAYWMSGRSMDSGFGLRTMSSGSGGYSPLSYHCGSVWPHDTAVVLLALARAGLAENGRGLVSGLLQAAEAFDYRLPELWSGDAADEVGKPVPYPAACRPQAWSVTSAIAVLQAVLGLEVDVPAGTVTLRPLRPSPVGRLRVEGLVVAGSSVTIEIDAAGEVLVAEGGGLQWSTAGRLLT